MTQKDEDLEKHKKDFPLDPNRYKERVEKTQRELDRKERIVPYEWNKESHNKEIKRLREKLEKQKNWFNTSVKEEEDRRREEEKEKYNERIKKYKEERKKEVEAFLNKRSEEERKRREEEEREKWEERKRKWSEDQKREDERVKQWHKGIDDKVKEAEDRGKKEEERRERKEEYRKKGSDFYGNREVNPFVKRQRDSEEENPRFAANENLWDMAARQQDQSPREPPQQSGGSGGGQQGGGSSSGSGGGQQPQQPGRGRRAWDWTKDKAHKNLGPRSYYNDGKGSRDDLKKNGYSSWDSMKNHYEALKNKMSYRDDVEKNTVPLSWLFILLALAVHAVKFGWEFNYNITWMIDVAFAILVYIFIFGSDEKNSKAPRILLFVLFLETLFPILISNLEALTQNKYLHYYLANRLLTPWWFYYAVIRGNDCKWPDKFSKIMKLLLFVFWIGVLFSFPAISFDKIQPSEYVTQQQTETAKDFYDRTKAFWAGVGGAIKEGIWSIGDAFRKSADIATGGYYTGIVDRNENRQLGVYIDRVRPTSTSFLYGSPVSVYGELEVLSLEDAVKLNMSCYEGRSNVHADEVYPEEERWFYRHQKEQIDCMFKPMMLPVGRNDIVVRADFNFETMAYQKAYFMDYETKMSLMRQNKDPLDEYGIRDKDPEAVYTNGPVMIGMGISGDQPIGIRPRETNTPRLGVTIESNTGWKGQIQELKELVIQVPDSMEIDVRTCNYDFIEDAELEEGGIERIIEGYKKYRSSQFRDCQSNLNLREDDFDDDGNMKEEVVERLGDRSGEFEECLKEHAELETEGHRTYYLDFERYGGEFKDIDTYKTFNCRINLLDSQEILGGSPLATHFFRAKARYQYEIEESVLVEIERDEHYEEPRAPSGIEVFDAVEEYFEDIEEIVEVYNEELEVYEIGGEPLLTPCLVAAVIMRESSGDPSAVGRDNEEGLMQVMPTTAEDVFERNMIPKSLLDEIDKNSYNLFYPRDNIIIGTAYIAWHLSENADNSKEPWTEEGISNARENAIKYGLADYNAGPGNMRECYEGPSYVFEECGNYYTRTPGFRIYPEIIWESKLNCKGYSFVEAEEKEAVLSEQIERFTISYPKERVEGCFDDINSHSGNTGELDERDKNEIKEVLDIILEERPEPNELQDFFEDKFEGCSDYTEENYDECRLKERKKNEKIDVINCVTGSNEAELIKNGEKSNEIQIEGTKYTLEIENMIRPLERQYEAFIPARLVFNEHITWPEFEIRNETTYISQNPFVRFSFEREGNEVEIIIKYFERFVYNTRPIFPHHTEDEIRMGETNDLLIVSASTREFRDRGAKVSINYYESQTDDEYELGSFAWTRSSSREDFGLGALIDYEDGRIKYQNPPPGLYFNNVYTDFDDRFDGNARIELQAVYDPNYEAKCCKEDPRDCDGSFELATCSEESQNEANCEIKYSRGRLECI